MEIFWTDHALGQLDEIYNYIATDSKIYAQKVIDKLTKATEQLAKFPESGRYVPEIEDDIIREMISGNYQIVYKVYTERIDILSVLHVRQLL